jgi:hypothetical protein
MNSTVTTSHIEANTAVSRRLTELKLLSTQVPASSTPKAVKDGAMISLDLRKLLTWPRNPMLPLLSWELGRATRTNFGKA